MNWLDAFVEYTRDMESPRPFFLWSAIGVLSHVLGRKVWLDRFGGRVRVYPGQMWIVLISDSAIARKTTAMDLAARFTQKLKPWQANILPEWTSPEAMLESLELKDEDGDPLYDPWGKRVPHVGLVMTGELTTILSKAAYMETLPQTLNRLNDCKRGELLIKFRSWEATLFDPCIGIMGCTTPDGWANDIPKSARKGGTFGRFLIVADNRPGNPNDGTEEIPLNAELTLALRRELRKRIAEMRGPFKWTKQSKAWFREWYHTVHIPYARSLSADQTESGYYGRRDSHLLRTAIVRSAAETSDRVIRLSHMEWSLKQLGKVERRMLRASKEIGMSQYADLERRLLNLMERWDARRRDPGWYSVRTLAKELWRYGAGSGRLELGVGTLVLAKEIRERGYGEKKEVQRRIQAGLHTRKADAGAIAAPASAD